MLNFIKKLFGKDEEISDYVPDKDPINWQPIVTKLEGKLGNHSIYLELKNGGWIKPEYWIEGLLVTGVAVAYVHEGVNPWETEAPARHKAEELSKIWGIDLPILLSRDFKHFVGYYVYINT
ncbi:hypothetical protein ACMXYV_08620 [Neptuniibacter sp. SY11_33]|uniref:hypothetical protein n=1 Tax=Neptuniibacter sp. SY11_33 TaxID=3398215 RepID=UPI0039F50DAD